MNRFVLILALALPVIASAQIRLVDTLQAVTWDAITADAIGATAIGSMCDSAIVSRWWGLDDCHKPKDTTRWYIKTIGDKCDTAYKKIYVPEPPPISNQNATIYKEVYERTITCKTDTTWAEKVQVWLRPEQLDKLMELVR